MSQDQKNKPQRAMGQLLADDPSGVGTTIVGGQPSGSPRKQVNKIPVGIERVLYAAAMEPVFRERLLADREAAIEERGFPLRPSELAMLRLTPAEQLEAAIDSLDTSAPSLERRSFMRTVAASLVTLAAANTINACADEITSDGIRPDPDGSPHYVAGISPDDVGTDNMKTDGPGVNIDAGVRADIEVDTYPMSNGIRPDGGE